jgi:hypothetical protein
MTWSSTCSGGSYALPPAGCVLVCTSTSSYYFFTTACSTNSLSTTNSTTAQDGGIVLGLVAQLPDGGDGG